LGKELDELILSMRPGFEFPSTGLKSEESIDESHKELHEEQADNKTASGSEQASS
jgi:hypothetical protein